MNAFVLVATGGAIGSIARYQVSTWVMREAIDWKFPLGTFVVNVFGCLVAGILAGLIEKNDLFAPETRLFLFTGILGGFTTFSAFGLETMFLIRRGELLIAGSNVMLSVFAGLCALWIGLGMSGLHATAR